jgi:ubiquinone/menaquinone biosynthesis C-methylase UbiE
LKHEDNPKSIKFHVKKYFLARKDEYKGKKVMDLPAGNGITCELLTSIGANPYPFDLFPEYFNVDGLNCQRADVLDKIPCDDLFFDAVICQEGIEHFSDQFKALKEFNRVLKDGGELIITTPNYSNLRARTSYFLSESERFNSLMPPNEIDSIWMNNQQITNEIYFGHVFLIGIQKLRVLAKLTGFKIKYIQKTQYKTTSMFLFPFFYPFIVLSSFIAYRKNLNKNKGYDKEFQKKVFKEQFKLNINPTILLDGHLFIVFEKEKEANSVFSSLKSVHKEFGTT